MLKEFKQFLLRGNVIDFAVGFVIAVAFGAVITALVSDLLTPVVAAIVKVPDFNGLYFTINGSAFMYGHFINVVASFIIIATVVFFFVIKPTNMIMAKTSKQGPADPTTKKCRECLSDIPIEARRCSHCAQVVANS